MFSSRDDYERVIKLLLATLFDGDEPPVVQVDRDHMEVAWTARELAEADRYRLDVTQRGYASTSGELELRLLPDDSWDPRYADDVEEDL
jgi:hypothetical protein